MSSIAPSRWDDYVLASLLLLVALPRAVIAVLYDRPLDVEGTISMLFIVLALAIVIIRRRS